MVLTQEQMEQRISSCLTAVLIYFLVKEMTNFVNSGGISDDYPMSRSLFLMILYLIGLGLLRSRSLGEMVLSIQDKLSTLFLKNEVKKLN